MCISSVCNLVKTLMSSLCQFWLRVGLELRSLNLDLKPYTTGVSWYSLITFALNFSSFGTYTFPSFNIKLSFCCYSLSLNIFIPAYFISFTAFTTSSSLASHFLTLSSKSIPSIITSAILILFTSSYSSVCFLLSLSTPTSQSSLLLNLFAFSIYSLKCASTQSQT